MVKKRNQNRYRIKYKDFKINDISHKDLKDIKFL